MKKITNDVEADAIVGSNSNYAYYNISFGDGYEQDVKEEYSWKDFNYINSDIIDAINKSNEQ